MSSASVPPAEPGAHAHDIYFTIAAGVLLAFMAWLAGGAALRESITVDEVAHIGAGVSYLQRFDLRLNVEHPPLPKIWAAIPLVLRGTHADYTHVSWTFSNEKLFAGYAGEWIFGSWLLDRWNNPVTTLRWARFPMLLLTLALGWSLFAIGRNLGGNWGGLLCLSTYVSMPAFLAFGPLVHTDIPVTLFTLLSLWTFAELWKEPSRRRVILFTLCFAGALLSKFTSGILLFAFGAFVLATRWWPVGGQPGAKPEKRTWRRLRWRALLKAIACAAAVVYVFYFIFSIRQPTNMLSFMGHGSAALAVRRILMPLWLYLWGLTIVLITGSRPTFILGHAYPHGVWFYYPVVFVLKSPLGFLGLLLLAALLGLTCRAAARASGNVVPAELRVHWRVLWVSFIVFTAICLLSRLDISIRHFTVPIALMIVMLAPLPRLLAVLHERHALTARAGAALAMILAASCLFTGVRAYPYYFPYINALGSGRPPYTLVNDSNVDWNQSLPAVAEFVQRHGLQRVALDWYGITDSVREVPGSYEWNCQQPSSGDGGQWAAVSANLILDSRNCFWLLQYPHQSLAGGSMLVFHLPDTIPQAGSPGGPPLPANFHHFFGIPFDTRAMTVGLVRNPENLPAVYAKMEEEFQKQAEARKNGSKTPSSH